MQFLTKVHGVYIMTKKLRENYFSVTTVGLLHVSCDIKNKISVHYCE